MLLHNCSIRAIVNRRDTAIIIPSEIKLSQITDKKKVQVGKAQENAQSEKDSHSKNRGGNHGYRKLRNKFFSGET